MKKTFSRSQLKTLARQVNSKPIGVDDLEDFCAQNINLKKEELHQLIWNKFGMFAECSYPKTMTFFTTKGGVLKTTVAYNFARIAALSGVKTLVIGLDMQCDMTNCLSGVEENTDQSLISALELLESKKGLFQYFNNQASLEEIICSTDLKCLNFIPEAPDLTLLNDSISLINRREFWLNDKVVRPLASQYDLIIFDCSPNWNRLTTNALCATDLLVSPVECKINNFKNIEVFNELIKQAKEDLFLQFKTAFVPTRFSKNKKLSCEILQWYQENLPGCMKSSIRESIESEEAIALQSSVVEYRPMSKVASDILNVTGELTSLIRSSDEVSFNNTQIGHFNHVHLERDQLLNNPAGEAHGTFS